MIKEIKEIDENYVGIVETETNERLVAKVTLEAQKAGLLQQIAEIDDMLTHFKAKG